MRYRALTAAITVSGVCALLLSGCAPRDSDVAASTPVDTAALTASLPPAQTAVDAVTWGLAEGEPSSLDPIAGGNFVTSNLCDNLLRLEPDFTVSAGLAVSADWTDDTTFVIELRDDATFWDGTPVTPEDVIYSFQRNQTPSSPWFPAFVLVTGMDKTGDHEITVRFSAPDSTFRNSLSGMAGAVLSKAYGDQAGAELGTATGGILCSGPYEFGSWTPGKEIITTANPDYWDGAPKVQTLTYVFVPDGTTLTNALLSGEIDGAFNVSPASRSAFESSDAGRLVVGPSTASYSLGPLNPDSVVANVAIRQALSLAIDRAQYVSTVLNGLGAEQNTFTPPFAFGGLEARDAYQAAYDDLGTPAVDLDRARALVEDSGVDTSTPIVVAVPAGSTELSQTAAIVQSAAESIGLTVQIDERQPADYTAIFYDPTAREGVDLIATTGWLDTPGVLQYAQQFLLPAELGGFYNWSGYSNDEVTAEIQTARTTLDPAASADAFIAAQSIFGPEQLQITLASAYQTTFLANGLTGVVTSIGNVSSPWALHLGGE
ncbi:ABC transporter substrate-binding protein [Microbacterium sp. cx-59]|uniref:ABC transporter substrate-binding protein n=1 Tax=Microbacterium sp. cx-59 TaxID=2891207 RepID=UPI001E60A863|nr:ABC transporter substrate-binding protein [Microbacterium sp. cx-59]MCC4908333.1 ABC transporter substrate-binding protein [Microbacterium sp. cx-59]